MSIFPLYGRGPVHGGEVSMGTTLVAAEFDGGVVVAADSRTSSGSMVVHRVSDKITPVVDGRIYCCRSGSSADTQAVTDAVKHHLNVYRQEHGVEPPVRIAAHVFGDMCYRYRDDISAGIIVAGWDEHEGGQVYSVPIGGMVTRVPIGSGGSGSVFLYGLLDSVYKGTPAGKSTLTREECERMLRQAVAHAIIRDGSSGGIIRMAVVTKEGVQRSIHYPETYPEVNS